MTRQPISNQRHEGLIALLLGWGTWLASAVIGTGLVMAYLGGGGFIIINAGIALFILLPVARVILMLALFAREKDYLYSAIAVVVLSIIIVGVVAGR